MVKGKFGINFYEKRSNPTIDNERSLIAIVCACNDDSFIVKPYGNIQNAIREQCSAVEGSDALRFLQLMQEQGSTDVILANITTKTGTEENPVYDYSLTDEKLTNILDELEDAVFNVLIIPYELTEMQIGMLNLFYKTKKAKQEIIGLYTFITPKDDGSNLVEFKEKWPVNDYTSFLFGAITTPLRTDLMEYSLAETTVILASNITNSPENSKVSFKQLTDFRGESTKRHYNNAVYESCLENSCIAFEYIDSITGKIVISNANTPSDDDLKIIRVYAAVVNALRRKLQEYAIGEDNNMITKSNVDVAVTLVRKYFTDLNWINDLQAKITGGGDVSCQVNIGSEQYNVLKDVDVFSELEVI